MRLHWLQPALADLEDIGDCVGRHSPSAAEMITARIVAAIDNLADLPGLGRLAKPIVEANACSIPGPSSYAAG